MSAEISKLSVLKKRAEFLAAAAHGKKWVTPNFILQMAPSPAGLDGVRFGLTASGKVGNAVVRNRCRRRLRNLAQEILPRSAMPAHDYVLVARVTASTADYALMKKDLLWALKRMGALRG